MKFCFVSPKLRQREGRRAHSRRFGTAICSNTDCSALKAQPLSALQGGESKGSVVLAQIGGKPSSKNCPSTFLGQPSAVAGMTTRRGNALRNFFVLVSEIPGLAAQCTDIVGVDEVGHGPAVEVVFGHAAVGEALPALVLARGDGGQQCEAPDFLVAAGVIDLVELVARAEFRADRVP